MRRLVRKIFLHLPSLPSLVRAALACPAFLAAVRSCPAFRRRFCELHPRPLLGFFFLYSDTKKMLSFTPVWRLSDPDLLAAVRGVDVFLTRTPCHNKEGFPGWDIMECRGDGLVLLNWTREHMAACNPLTQAVVLVAKSPIDDICNGYREKWIPHDEYCLLYSPSDEAPDMSSFRVVFSCHDKSRLRAAVFSSTAREWQILPWSEPAPKQPARGTGLYRFLGRSQQFLCWSNMKHAFMTLLDTTTLRFSFIDLPVFLKGQCNDDSCRAGDTKDGKLCIVAAVDFTLFVWILRADRTDGVDKWMLDNVIDLEGEVLRATQQGSARRDHGWLDVRRIVDGIVYLSSFAKFKLLQYLVCTYPSAWKQGSWKISLIIEILVAARTPTSWRGLVL